MQIIDHFHKNCVIPELEVENKADVLRCLIDLLFETHKLHDRDQVMAQIVAREATESTGIGHGIAIPHARISKLNKLHCAIGRSTKGIDFSAVDRKNVHLVFLIVYPPVQQNRYLDFVATLTRLLRNPGNFKAIMAATTAKDILETLGQLANPTGKTENGIEEELASIENMEIKDVHVNYSLMARLQLLMENLATAQKGKKQYQERIAKTRNLIDSALLNHFDKLMRSRPPAVVAVEGDTCQGCFMKLPTQFVQQVRTDLKKVYTCPYCRRFIFLI